MRHPLWENPEVIGIGREPMGAHFHIYGNSQDAHNQTGEQTVPLEGQWTFNLYASPENVPQDWLSIQQDGAEGRASLFRTSGPWMMPSQTNPSTPMCACPFDMSHHERHDTPHGHLPMLV